MHRRALPLALVAGLALGLSACGSSNDDESEIARGRRRCESSARCRSTGSRFARARIGRRRGELQPPGQPRRAGASIFPPTSVGSFQAKSSSGMSWTWLNIDFRAEDGCYFWLIDGTELGFFYENVNNDYVFVREPQLVRLPSPFDRKSSVGFAGTVTSPAWWHRCSLPVRWFSHCRWIRSSITCSRPPSIPPRRSRSPSPSDSTTWNCPPSSPPRCCPSTPASSWSR